MIDLDQYVANLLQWEGCPSEPTGCFPYLDTKGLVTFGIGEHLSIEAFCDVPWVVPIMPLGSPYVFRPGIESEVVAAYNELLHEGQSRVFPFPASHYAQFTSIRMPKDVALQRCKDRLAAEFLPAVESALDHHGAIDAVPTAALRVLVDLAWNTGAQGFAKGWPRLLDAVANQDWHRAASECVTGNGDGPRNVWRRDLMLSCAGQVTS